MAVMRISVWMSKTVTTLCVPITSSTSCDQPIFVDHATDVSLFSDAVQVEVDLYVPRIPSMALTSRVAFPVVRP
jgi:hypothetical protein